MFRGLYTATSGMMAHNRKQQILTNNLANANTPGYKQDQTVLRAFPAQLIQAMQMGSTTNSGVRIPPGQNAIGTINTGVYAQEGVPSYLQGPLKETGNTTDFSLLDDLLPINTQQKGTLMFAVALDTNEIRYTKNGQFTVNQDGFLTTSEGYNVLNQDLQPIQVNSKEFKVLENGQIVLPNGTANNYDRLWLGYTEEPEQFIKEGHGLLQWRGNPEDGPQFVDDVDLLNNTASFVKQGFIEQSNVDVTNTMTEMISTYRGFEANQKVIQAYDRSMEKAVNDIGRIY